ncbi:MAG: HAMP domain-containing histidine kinase [Myxococcales bacterium]|nr:HAMP domain-containing histidine kinase [Myxococcales bacterium]
MKAHRSLLAKIILWSFVNLFVLGALVFGFFNLQFHLGPESPFGGPPEDPVLAIGRLLTRELSAADRENWDKIFTEFAGTYGVTFTLLTPEGDYLGGDRQAIPPAVREKIMTCPRGMGRGMGMGMGMARRGHPGGMPEPLPDSPQGRFMQRHSRFSLRTTNPTRYWVGQLYPVVLDRENLPQPAFLLAVSDSMTGHGLFFNPTPWIVIALAIVLISFLLWAPFVRNLTRPLTQMTDATAAIARGQFEVNLPARRRDEIGRLGQAINDMAARLAGFVKGQKRFLGDVAHELASPIARINLGLSILEQRVDEPHRERVREVLEEVQQLSNLVNELLSFSRAEMNPAKVRLESVELAPIVRRIVPREGGEGCDIRVAVDEEIRVQGDPELLARALANVLRNAVRYAGEAGPIFIEARQRNGEVEWTVRDSGKGVPPDSLGRLFEPFFRPEASRGRDTGGVGLGLAIVKTCVQACGGTVGAQNLQPAGFAVTMTLKAG